MADMFRPVPIDQEPHQKSRFVVEFPTEIGIESYLVKTVSSPTISVGSIEIPYMHGYDYVAGKIKYEPIDITFIDVIGPSTSQKIMEWLGLHYEGATGRMGYAVGYKKQILLKRLDPTGVEVQKWTFIGCQITNVKFADGDYGAEEVSEISMTIQPNRILLDA